MGRLYMDFRPPPPEIEEMHWLDVTNNKIFQVTKLEPIEKTDWLIHCIDNAGCTIGIFGCPCQFILEVKVLAEFKMNVDVSHRRVFFVAWGAERFDVMQQ